MATRPLSLAHAVSVPSGITVRIRVRARARARARTRTRARREECERSVDRTRVEGLCDFEKVKR